MTPQRHATTLRYASFDSIDAMRTAAVISMLSSGTSRLKNHKSTYGLAMNSTREHTLRPGFPVKLPLSFIMAPLILSPTLGLRC